MQSADQTNIPDNNQGRHFFLVKGVARGGKGKVCYFLPPPQPPAQKSAIPHRLIRYIHSGAQYEGKPITPR